MDNNFVLSSIVLISLVTLKTFLKNLFNRDFKVFAYFTPVILIGMFSCNSNIHESFLGISSDFVVVLGFFSLFSILLLRPKEKELTPLTNMISISILFLNLITPQTRLLYHLMGVITSAIFLNFSSLQCPIGDQLNKGIIIRFFNIFLVIFLCSLIFFLPKDLTINSNNYFLVGGLYVTISILFLSYIGLFPFQIFEFSFLSDSWGKSVNVVYDYLKILFILHFYSFINISLVSNHYENLRELIEVVFSIYLLFSISFEVLSLINLNDLKLFFTRISLILRYILLFLLYVNSSVMASQIEVFILYTFLLNAFLNFVFHAVESKQNSKKIDFKVFGMFIKTKFHYIISTLILVSFVVVFLKTGVFLLLINVFEQNHLLYYVFFSLFFSFLILVGANKISKVKENVNMKELSFFKHEDDSGGYKKIFLVFCIFFIVWIKLDLVYDFLKTFKGMIH